MRPLNRRRFIAISAAAAGCSLMPFGAQTAQPMQTVAWRGRALGATASLVIHHHDRPAGERLLRQVVSELERLEQIFSLYRPNSTLSQLNRQGALAAPPPELVAALVASREVWEATDGAFDPTVQPLWTALADHFSRPGADQAGPAPARIREALSLVGFERVMFDRDRIAFGERGMALTLNGIAQGFITDRAVDVLRRGGVEKSLVDMGEIRALGTRVDGSPWRVGIGDVNDAELDSVLEIADRAVATSSADGFRFDELGRFSHLLDPRSGRGNSTYRSVTVIAPNATSADAFSTAFSLMPPERIRRALDGQPAVQVDIVSESGHRIAL